MYTSVARERRNHTGNNRKTYAFGESEEGRRETNHEGIRETD